LGAVEIHIVLHAFMVRVCNQKCVSGRKS